MKDFSWEDEKIRERSSISKEKKIDGEGKERENDRYLGNDPAVIMSCSMSCRHTD